MSPFRLVLASVALAVAVLCAAAQTQARIVRAPFMHASAAKQRCPSWPGGTGILTDGDFHEATYPGSWIDFTAGERIAPEWLVTVQSADLNGTYFQSPDGICAIDLDGYEPGAIMHRPFATIPGAQYTVTFLFSGNGSNLPAVKHLRVEAAGQHLDLRWAIAGGNDAQHGIYTQQTWVFTAITRHTKLRFLSRDRVLPGRQNGPVVAAVSVTPV